MKDETSFREAFGVRRKTAAAKGRAKRRGPASKRRAKPKPRTKAELDRAWRSCERRLSRAATTTKKPKAKKVAAKRSEKAKSFEVEAVRTARARDLPRFGRYKVFVGPLAARLAEEFRIGEPEAKERLLAMHRAGLLALARADLTSAMDPALVRASEIPYLHTSFHFVNLEGS